LGDDATRPATRKARFRAVLLVALLGLLVHVPALGNRFAYDDGAIARSVLDDGRPNPFVGELRPLGEYFTTEFWRACGRKRLDSRPLYRPVTLLSFALLRALAPREDPDRGNEAFLQHAANLLLHAVAAGLAALLLAALGAGGVLTAAGGLVFALHAIHGEAVASIAGRAELLAFVFGLGACLLTLRRGFPALCAAALLFFLAFASKENALAFGPFALLLALLGPRAGRTRRTARALLPAFLAFALWFLLRARAFADLSPADPIAYVANPIAGEALSRRLLTAIPVEVFGILRLLWPLPLSSDHGPEVLSPVRSALDPRFLFSAFAIAGLLLLAWRLRGKNPVASLGIASLFLFSFIPSNLAVPIGAIYAERLWFQPSLALPLLCLGWGCALLHRLPRALRPATLGLLALWILGNAVLAFQRAGVWKDDRTLFLHDVEVRPRSLMLRIQAAIQELRAGNRAAWRRHLEAAIRIQPELARPYLELGGGRIRELDARAGLSGGIPSLPGPSPSREHLRAHRSGYEEAAALLERAARCRLLEAHERPLLEFNRAVAACRLERPGEAFPRFRRLLSAPAPEGNADLAHRILGISFGILPAGGFRTLLDMAEKRFPGLPRWKAHRARAAFLEGRARAALRLYRESLGEGIAWPLRADYAAWADLERRLGSPARAREIESRFLGGD